MQTDRTAKERIIRKALVRLTLINIVVLAATNVCGIIDNMVITTALDTAALAAVGYFAPMIPVIGLCYVLITGTLILCGNLIGSGQQARVRSLFTGAFAVLSAVFLLFSAFLFFFRVPLAEMLGAKGDVRKLLEDYIAGYAACPLFSALDALLIALASYNNSIKRSYVSAAVMVVTNIIFDLLLVGPLGIFGIGFASALSSLISLLILLPSYMNRKATLHFVRQFFDPGLITAAVMRGLPALLFTAGMLVKNSLMNFALSENIGYEGVAVANVLGTMCSILGIISGGCVNAYLVLASQYYGEEDREGFLDVFQAAFRIGLSCMIILLAIVIIGSGHLAAFFFPSGGNIQEIGQEMFVLGFIFFPVNFTINLLMGASKAQNRMKLVNILSFLEVAMVGVLAYLTVPYAGTKGAWLANAWSDLLTLAIIIIPVPVMKRKSRISQADLLKLPDDFGAGPGDYVEYTVREFSQVSAVSQSVIDFCRAKGAGKREAFLAGLCVEEMTGNLLEHGISHMRHNDIDVRVVYKDELTISIVDTYGAFDPRDHMALYNPDTPDKNIGLRIVAESASYIDYYNNAGINSLIMKI